MRGEADERVRCTRVLGARHQDRPCPPDSTYLVYVPSDRNSQDPEQAIAHSAVRNLVVSLKRFPRRLTGSASAASEAAEGDERVRCMRVLGSPQTPDHLERTP